MADNLRLIELDADPGIEWGSIFNTYAYFYLHKTPGSHYFALSNGSSKAATAICHFTETEKGVFKSPGRGTFAGPELQENDIETLALFISQIELKLKEQGARQIILSTAPFHHNAIYSAQLFNTLFNAGYTIENHELNYAVNVDSIDLLEKMHRNNKKRLNKCIREGLNFEQVFNETGFKEIYDILSENRKSKGYPMSMTFEQVMQMQRLFPDRILFFRAVQEGKSIAASVCIKISTEVLYVFYWGDLPGYEQLSAVSLIASGIYAFAQKNNFRLLDAGTSTLKGVPNYGLIKFKETLGFSESLKLTYVKNLLE